MRRSVIAAAAVLILGMGAFAVVRYKPWHPCRSGGTGSTAQAAIGHYYQSCGSKPKLDGPGYAGKGSTAYASWNQVVEYRVTYRSGDVRFLLVGQQTATSRWKVLDGEGSGP
jgi:hypothetical protein